MLLLSHLSLTAFKCFALIRWLLEVHTQWCLLVKDMFGPGVNHGHLETCNSVDICYAWIFLFLFAFAFSCLIFIVFLCRKQISTPMRVQGLERVRIIAVGAFHNLALLEDGILWAWGNNEYGQLGTGDTQPRSQPIPVQGLSGLTLVCIMSNLFLFLYCETLLF